MVLSKRKQQVEPSTILIILVPEYTHTRLRVVSSSVTIKLGEIKWYIINSHIKFKRN